MNADFQNPPQVPRAKVRSHLTIRVQSRRMPRPCPPGHGSKPPVAPKPKGVRAFVAQGGRRSPQALTNGDLLHSNEETDLKEKDNEGKTETEERLNGVTAGEVRVQTDRGAIAHQKQDDDIERVGSEDAVGADDASAEDGEDPDQNSARPDVGQNEDTPAASENEEPDSGDQEPTDQNSGEEKLRPIYSPSPGESKCVQFHLPSDDGALENARFLFGFRTLPTVTEEYPYDVIGPADDSGDARESRGPAESGDGEVWQPERATKDVSGCFRFTSGTEDAFGPYSVIESVPSDQSRTADPEWGEDDADETQASAQPASAPADPEPFYVSTDDVDRPEDERVLADGAEVEEGTEDGNPHGDKTTDAEAADEYADIEDPCRRRDEDLERPECASSEDYVEIGDEDEEERPEKRPAKGRSAKERTAQREQAFLSQRRSCQPSLRLCNITVPQDLDLGRTPELTNRVVFAHTTEAFEEEIEELDCHIVPFHEDTDSDSEEHIYEEAGFDSEGENFLNLDRKAAVTRSRSYSGKVPGYVPETVPEETGAEYQAHDDCAVPPDRNGEPIGRSQTPGDNRSTPPPKFLSSGRSAGSPDSALAKQSLTDELQIKRRDDALSLPCVRTSSGSFSQRSRRSSSGVSTPTSLVDIPPPFELAYITKRPVTKSSPSLLIQHDADDKLKKKKISFKRLLALKFKRKADSKGLSDGSVRSSRSSSESSHHGAARVIELDRRSASGSPQLRPPIVSPQRPPSELPSTFVFYKDPQRRRSDLKAFGRGLSRVESFEERSHRCAAPLPLTKPRSISFPSADTCDYENIPAMSSDYENIQIPGRPARSHTVTEFFDDPHRAAAPCNENDGYVDMNSFPGIDGKPSKADPESAYTEPFPLSSAEEEDHGRTSEEEEGPAEQSCDRPTDGRSRAFYVAKELVDSERLHVSALKYLQEGFRPAVDQAVAEDGGPLLDAQRLEEILGVLPQVLTLHSNILAELEERIHHWEEGQRVADVILSHREDFRVFDTFISEYERSMALLEESCKVNPAFASTVKKFERRSAEDAEVPLKQQLLQVLLRVLQYGMLLTDYLNNLSPDSQEYEDTQAALVVVSEVADQANDNLKQGENLLRMVHIEYSLKGKRELLKAGRMFVKEGTLMKVSRKSRQPRHLFLMNDIMLYTYPQQDGKYRLKNTLSLSGMKVSKPVLDNVLNCLKIEVSDITITLSASSVGEREDWFHTLSRAIADHAAGLCTFGGACNEMRQQAREKLWMALGEAAPVPVPPSHAMMCMNCTSDFSLTLRRHHCNACGKVVCRACSRNRCPLKYLKDRPAKVCDRCFAELRKRGGGESGACGNSSPPSHRASRPLSAVFQSWQTPSLWKSRRSTASLNQLPHGVDGSAMSGVLQRRKKNKRKWKRLWFLLKDKVLYTFTAREDEVASESLPLQGFTVKLTERPEADDSGNVFHLYHKKSLYCSFRAEDHHTARRWVDAIEEATIL